MPELAKLIQIETGPSSHSFKIDGEEFPWYVAEGGMTHTVTRDGCPIVTISLLADRVEIINDWSRDTVAG